MEKRQSLDSPIQFKLAYRTITNDLLKLCEYIDPCEENAGAYSHRTFELFLRTCTELENLWKYLLRSNNHPPGKAWDVRDYVKIEQLYHLHLSDKVVSFVYWKPEPNRYWKPFSGWLTAEANQPRLPWYAAYNEVKHDRDRKFKMASLENLIDSIAALHICLDAAFGYSAFFHQTMPSTFRVSGLPETFLLFQKPRPTDLPDAG